MKGIEQLYKMSIIKCTDHLGNKYASIKEMCRCHNIPYSTFISRIQHNWSLKDALTIPYDKTYPHKTKPIDDGFGNQFDTVNEMCAYHQVKPVTYRKRIRKGMSVKDALSPQKQLLPQCKSQTDHLGNKYISIKNMCDHYDIPVNTYQNRIAKGWPKEKALTTPPNAAFRQKIPYDDRNTVAFKNIEFKNITAICKYYKICPTTYDSRIKKMSMEEALTTGNFKPNEIIGIYTIIKELPNSYYLVNTKNYGETICHLNTLLDEYHKTRN